MRHTLLNIIAIAMAIIAMLALSSCATKKKEKYKEDINASYIHSINATNAIRVTYTSEDKTSVTAICDSAYQSYLNVRVENGVLHAALTGNAQVPVNGIEVKVSAPAITEFHASTAATIVCKDLHSDGDIKVTTETAGQVMISNLECRTLNVESTTASNVTVKTLKCDLLNSRISLAASNLFEGECKKIHIQKGTSAECYIDNLRCDVKEVTSTEFHEGYTTPEERREKYKKQQELKAAGITPKAENPQPASTDSTKK